MQAVAQHLSAPIEAVTKIDPVDQKSQKALHWRVKAHGFMTIHFLVDQRKLVRKDMTLYKKLKK